MAFLETVPAYLPTSHGRNDLVAPPYGAPDCFAMIFAVSEARFKSEATSLSGGFFATCLPTRCASWRPSDESGTSFQPRMRSTETSLLLRCVAPWRTRR